MKTIEEIRKALHTIHDFAMGKSRAPYMSVPANHDRDADLILSAAIDELEQLRASVATLAQNAALQGQAATLAEAERDRAREEADAESKLGTVLAGELAAEKLAHHKTTERLFEMQNAAIAIAKQVSTAREEQREVTTMEAHFALLEAGEDPRAADSLRDRLLGSSLTATPLADRQREQPQAPRTVEFWTCSPDEERLSCEEVEEAVEQCLDGLDDAELTAVKWPLKVYGWSRLLVSDKDLESLGVSLAERADEWLNEEAYGDPDGAHDVLDPTAEARLALIITSTLAAARDAGEISPWACEVIETREVTEAEARAWCPGMFAEGR